MARIKIQIPEGNPLYTTSLEVRIDDMNYGNHMGNDTVLRFFHEARVRYLKSKNFSELNVLGHSLIMGDAAVNYKNEAFQGDQISIDLYCDDFHKYGFDFVYKIKRGSDEIARGKTGMLFFDYEERKLLLAPEALEENLKTKA